MKDFGLDHHFEFVKEAAVMPMTLRSSISTYISVVISADDVSGFWKALGS